MVEAHPRQQAGALIDESAHADGIATATAMRDLSMAVQRLRHALARRGHLAASDVQVLEQLLAGPVGYGDLARRTGVTRSAISNIADRLIRNGLASRSFDLVDRRRTFLELTDRGREEMSSFLGPVLAVLDALDQSVTPDEREVVRRYLRDATRAYEAVEALVSRWERQEPH